MAGDDGGLVEVIALEYETFQEKIKHKNMIEAAVEMDDDLNRSLDLHDMPKDNSGSSGTHANNQGMWFNEVTSSKSSFLDMKLNRFFFQKLSS